MGLVDRRDETQGIPDMGTVATVNTFVPRGETRISMVERPVSGREAMPPPPPPLVPQNSLNGLQQQCKGAPIGEVRKLINEGLNSASAVITSEIKNQRSVVVGRVHEVKALMCKFFCFTVLLKAVLAILAVIILADVFELPAADGFIVYDCDSTNVTLMALDLYEPAECMEKRNHFRKPETAELMLLQTTKTTIVQAKTCNLIISKFVSGCGFDGIAYNPRDLVFRKSIRMSEEECLKAHARGIFDVERHFSIDLSAGMAGPPAATFPAKWKGESNYVFRRTFMRHGHAKGSYCKGATFNAEGELFKNSYMQLAVEFTMTTVEGLHHRANSDLVFGTLGLKGKYLKGVIYDAQVGTVVWHIDDPTCTNTLSKVYEGEAHVQKYIGPEANLAMIPAKSIVLINNTETHQYAAVKITDKHVICGFTCFKTHLHEFIVCPSGLGNAALSQLVFQPQSQVLPSEVSMKISYAAFQLGSQLVDTFRVVESQICERERASKINDLQALSGSQNQHAVLEHFNPGTQVEVVGGTAYLRQCPQVEARWYGGMKNCTQEIPVEIPDGNGTKIRFADPLSFIVKRYPSVIPCSSITPPRFRIQGSWFCLYPALLPCDAPRKLNITSNGLYFEPFDQGIGQSIYTPEMIRQHQALMDTLATRKSLLTNVAADAVEHNRQRDDGSLILIPDAQYLHSAQKEMFEYYSPVMYWLGELCGSWFRILCILFFVTLLLKILIGCLVRMLHTYERYGCGIEVVMAIWGTLYMVITGSWRAFQVGWRAATADLEVRDPYLRRAEMANNRAGRARQPRERLAWLQGIRWSRLRRRRDNDDDDDEPYEGGFVSDAQDERTNKNDLTKEASIPAPVFVGPLSRDHSPPEYSASAQHSVVDPGEQNNDAANGYATIGGRAYSVSVSRSTRDK